MKEEDDGRGHKRPRGDGDDEDGDVDLGVGDGEASALSPQQKRRMLESRTKSLIVRQCRATPAALDPSVGPSWYEALAAEFERPYFKELDAFLRKERAGATRIFPSPADVWSWTRDFAVADTKVVVLGQDPYHGPGQAHGLCFSVRRGVPPPPSLVNMYKELESDVEGFRHPGHGCLQGWADQGVLLLNAVLTVRQSQPNSHKDKGWERVTDAVVRHLSDPCRGVVFLLWGSYAQ